MKKLVSLISALTMCAVMAAPMVSSATDVTYDDAQKTSTVDCRTIVASSYTVTIPDGTADLKDPADLVVSASDVCIKGGQTLKVDVSSANAWKLSDEHSGDLAYKLTAMNEVETKTTTENEEGEEVEVVKTVLEEGKVLVSRDTAETVGSSITVLEIEAGTATGKSTMRAEVEDKATMAGTYRDTLTFTVSVTPEYESEEQTEGDKSQEQNEGEGPQTPSIENDENEGE